MRELLSKKGVRFTEYDVASNQTAAAEMVRRSGQMGVPVTIVDDQVIIGFDRPGIERALASQKPSLGIKAADASSKGRRPGALVGEVHPGSPGEQAGLQPGDIIIEVDGQKIWSATDLGKTIAYQGRGKVIALTVLRGDERLVFRAPL